ncbi:protein translocase subunit SecF, partial [Psychrobacter sp. SIMBA_152]
VMIYLAVRFEWRLALGSVVALLHDLVLVVGLFSWLQIEFNLTVLASLLAIIGYSLNDSIIVGDRVRELLRIPTNISLKPSSIINSAIKSTLTRTLITSGTTLA